MHGARRVRFGHVERGEIVPVVLDLGTGGDREAEVGENFGKLVHHLADRVDAAARCVRRRQGEVERFGGEPRFEGSGVDRVLARGQRVGDVGAQGLDLRRLALAFLRAHLAQRLHQCGDGALLAQELHAQGLESGGIAGFLDSRERGVPHCCQIGH